MLKINFENSINLGGRNTYFGQPRFNHKQ